jgi:protein tyrosine phosphatase (PTP) superfamily phosphohydrolase (DUF442 family)
MLGYRARHVLWPMAIRAAKYAGLAGLAAIALPAFYVTVLQVTGNFHVVEPGAAYRSAQPSAGDLARYARKFGIQSIINLRDAAPGDSAGAERQTAQDLGLTYIHYPLPSSRLLNAGEITGIIKILAEAPKPVLIHSYLGADRAGIVSALYLFRVEGKTADESSSQLSPAYGHLPYLGNPTSAMDKTFHAVVSVQQAGL